MILPEAAGSAQYFHGLFTSGCVQHLSDVQQWIMCFYHDGNNMFFMHVILCHVFLL